MQLDILGSLDDAKAWMGHQFNEHEDGSRYYFGQYRGHAGGREPHLITCHGYELFLTKGVYDLRASCKYLAGPSRIRQINTGYSIVDEDFHGSFYRAAKTLVGRGLLRYHRRGYALVGGVWQWVWLELQQERLVKRC